MVKVQYWRFFDRNNNEVDMDSCGGELLALRRCGIATLLDRHKARELAAILTHFAETGELPGEVGNGPIPGV